MIPKILLDFETSGLNPYHDDIIEVAMKNMDSDDEYSSLLKPKSNECISSEITTLTGITNKMLAKEGKSWEEVYKFINEWLLSMLEEHRLMQSKQASRTTCLMSVQPLAQIRI